MRMVRLIPFVYSSSIAYLVELGDGYMRFFYDDEVIAEISSPFAEADIFEIHNQQIADVMRKAHPTYAPRKLSRTSAETFELSIIEFRRGPFLTRNDLLDPDNPSAVTLASSVTAAEATGTLTASSGVFLPGHEGALFKLIHKRTVTQVSQSGPGTSDELSIYGTANFITTGTWQGKVILQRQENDSAWEDYRTYEALTSGARNDSLAFTEKAENVKYRIYAVAGMSSGFGATLNAHNPNQEGIVRVTDYTSEYVVSIEVLSVLASTDATNRWAEGAWSDVRGWPTSLAFFENRCCYAGGVSDVDPTTAFNYPELQDMPEEV